MENPLGVGVEVMKQSFVWIEDVEEVEVESSAAGVGAAGDAVAELVNSIFGGLFSSEQLEAVR